MWCFILWKENFHGKASQRKQRTKSTRKSRKVNKNTSVEELCSKLPNEFAKYLNYWRSLNFEDKPWISDLKRLFKKLLQKKGLDPEGKFDWVTKKSKIPQMIEFEEANDDEPDYKKKLKDLLKNK